MYNKCFTYNGVDSLSVKFFFFHMSMPLIDRPFTNGTLVGENISNKIKMKTKSAIIPSRIDIFNATQRLTNVE